MKIFDSMIRYLLPPYGCDWVKAENFNNLTYRSVAFACCYDVNFHYIPARRELHTGRHNFMHRMIGSFLWFSGLYPLCHRLKDGCFTVRRKTIAKRFGKKGKGVTEELKRIRHSSVPRPPEKFDSMDVAGRYKEVFF